MEKPYHGLPYHGSADHAPKATRPAPPHETEDGAWDEPEPLERAYPDGSAPAECWGYTKAFSQKQSGGDGTCSGI